MRDLISRLENAESGSENLSADMCIATGYAGANSDGAVNIRTDDDWEGDLLFEIGPEECCNPIPALTTSLDAIVSLIGEKLPGCTYDAGTAYQDGGGYAKLYPWPLTETEHAKTAPLALCIALLRALDTEGGKP